MKIVSLISGGKDSTFNMMACVAEGHEIVALANLFPDNGDELDSFMYQTVGHMGIEMYAEAMGLPLFREKTSGKTSQGGSKSYEPEKGDEVEDLYRLLSNIKEVLAFDGVSCGCILSDYQRIRCENVCNRLQLKCFSYLYRRDQVELLQEMVESNLDAILIKVACLGLNCEDHLGKSISQVQRHMESLNTKFGCNVCGEGGEYETFTLDCPLFKKKIVIDDCEKIVTNNSDPKWTVGHMNFLKMHLEEKNITETPVGIKKSEDFVKEFLESEEIPLLCKQYIQSELDSVSVEEARNELVDKTSQRDWLWVTVEGFGESAKEGFLSALHQIDIEIKENQMNINQSVYVVMYINDMSSYSILNDIYNEKFNFQNPPPRVCVETCLPSQQCKVIFEVLIFKNKESESFQSFHVQGISHWAAANIGPYSQLKTIKNITFISGQIGLIPGNLNVISGGIENENRLALRHIDRVIKAVGRDSDSSVIHAVCYVTRLEHITVVKDFWMRKCNQAVCTNYVVVAVLPRNALVEWQVYYHRNCEFNGDEIIEKRVGLWNLHVRKNYSSECLSCIGKIYSVDEKQDFDSGSFGGISGALYSSLENLLHSDLTIQVKVFLRTSEIEKLIALTNDLKNVFGKKKFNFSIIPVKHAEDNRTLLSLSVVGFL